MPGPASPTGSGPFQAPIAVTGFVLTDRAPALLCWAIQIPSAGAIATYDFTIPPNVSAQIVDVVFRRGTALASIGDSILINNGANAITLLSNLQTAAGDLTRASTIDQTFSGLSPGSILQVVTAEGGVNALVGTLFLYWLRS